jgi:hypothetical protein
MLALGFTAIASLGDRVRLAGRCGGTDYLSGALGCDGAPMKKVEEYRAHAEECRLMAARARTPREKDMLINMAATWESVAVDRQARIARQKRMAELGNGAAASIPIDHLNASNDD